MRESGYINPDLIDLAKDILQAYRAQNHKLLMSFFSYLSVGSLYNSSNRVKKDLDYYQSKITNPEIQGHLPLAAYDEAERQLETIIAIEAEAAAAEKAKVDAAAMARADTAES